MPFTSFDYQQIIRGDVQQLSSLFAAAAMAIPAPEGGAVGEDFDQLAKLVEPSLDPAQPLTAQAIKQALPPELTLAPALQLRLSVAEQLLAALLGSHQFDVVLQRDLNKLSLPFFRLIARDDSFLSNPDHPARQLLNEILLWGYAWYPRDSKPVQTLYEKLQQLIHAAITAWNSSAPQASLASTVDEFRTWAAGEDKRAQMLETRLCESELAGMKLLATECQVLDLINNSLAGKTLPVVISEQLPLLKSELQHCLINDGTSAPFWQVWQGALPLLGQVFRVLEAEVDEQQLYRDIPKLLGGLERSVHRERIAAGHYQSFIDTLSQVLMQAIRKQTLDCHQLQALPYPAGYTDSNTRVTAAILQQGKALATGDWILFRGEDDQLIRCKLALKMPDSDHLLFVDRSGRKVMIKNIKDVSLCLSTGVAQPLRRVAIEDVIVNMIHQLIARGDKYAEQQQREEAQKRELILAAKRIAAHKATAEALTLGRQKQERELAAKALEQQAQEQQQAAQAAEKSAREKLTMEQVAGLNVGAWIEIVASESDKTRCKLSVIIGAAGKYIFVDQVGRKAAEFQRAQLIQNINDNQIKIISYGDKFEDQLVKVIRGLRKDVS